MKTTCIRLIALVCVAAILFAAVAMPDALAAAELLVPLWLFLWLVLVLPTLRIKPRLNAANSLSF